MNDTPTRSVPAGGVRLVTVEAEGLAAVRETASAIRSRVASTDATHRPNHL